MCCRVWLSRSLGEKVKLPYDPSRLYLEATHAQHGPLRQLHPIPEQLHVHEFSFDGHPVTIHASTVNSAAGCPGCGRSSWRVHGSYSRTCPSLRNAVLKPETGKPEEGVLLAFLRSEKPPGELWQARKEEAARQRHTSAWYRAVGRHPTPLPRRGGRTLHLPMKLGISPRTVYLRFTAGLRRAEAAGKPPSSCAPRARKGSLAGLSPTAKKRSGSVHATRREALRGAEGVPAETVLLRRNPGRCPSAYPAVLARMIRGLEGEKLDGWLEEAEASEAQVMKKFAISG
jgi:hypothetical protein